MSSEDKNNVGLVPSQTSSLSHSGAASLIRRGRQDLIAKAQTDQWRKQGLARWRQRQYEEAVECFRRLQLDPNHAELQFLLGTAYYREDSAPGRDYTQAAFWYRKAAEQGHSAAQALLGIMYQWSWGVPQDYQEALTFTGRWLPKTPADILSRGLQFNALYSRIDQANGQSKGKRDFELLWAGEGEKAGFPSMSEAVFVLCQMLNAKYNNDAAKVDEQFRQSGLYSGHRIEKWDRLGADTIAKTQKPAEAVIGRKEWKLEKFSSIVREEINWIFQGYVARGKITGLSGEPGCGKSLIILDWGARFSSGRGWPDGAKALQPPGKILIFATEDDAGDTILPRFEAAGGKADNLLRIRLEGDTGFYFDNPKHLEVLRMVTEQNPDIGMVIIDPILEHMRADKEQATREAYAPLRALIAQRGVALLQVAHTNKQAAQNLGSVGDKVGGVKALVGLPRFVYSVHATDDGLAHLCPVKQNVGKRVTHSMDFRIEETDGQPHLEWTGEGIASASDGLTIQGGKTRGGCADDLKTMLTGDWQESAGVKGKLLAMGYGLATVSRAASQLGMTGELQQDRRGRLTFWRKSSAAGEGSGRGTADRVPPSVASGETGQAAQEGSKSVVFSAS